MSDQRRQHPESSLTSEVLRAARVIYEFQDIDCGHRHADFVLALGGHDVRVADRAAQLWHEQAAPVIVCTGGQGRITRHLWASPEAEVFAARCRELGVPREAILIEERAQNTGENLSFTKVLLRERLPGARAGILVCRPYAGRRALATAEMQWPEIDWHVSSPALGFDDYSNETVSLDVMVHAIVGDIQRLLVYPSRGFQVPVPVPGEVEDALEILLAAGFDQHALRGSDLT